MSDCVTEAIKIEPQDENVGLNREPAQSKVHVKEEEYAEVECEEVKIRNCDQDKPQDGNASEGILLLFTCIFCDKIFITAAALNAHKAIHAESNTQANLDVQGVSNVIQEPEIMKEVKIELHEEMMTYNGDSEQQNNAADPLHADCEQQPTDSTNNIATTASIDCEEETKVEVDEPPGSIEINGLTVYPCDCCSDVFAKPEILENHLKKHMTQCGVCNEMIPNKKAQLTAHINLHKPAGIFKCDVCNKNYQTRKGLRIHKRLHTGEKRFVCDICDKKFHRRACYNLHMTIHTGKDRCVCEVCGKMFSVKTYLEIHKLIHLADKPVKCELCGKGFAKKQGLDVHMKRHMDGISFLCKFCQRFFKSKQTYDIHVLEHTESSYTCKVCDKKYTKRHSYLMHLRTHGGKRFKCEFCEKDFARKGELAVHANTHSKKTCMYMCEVCGKGFYKKALLMRHKFLHSDKKPHTCECGKGFVFLSQLKGHRCALMKEKPFRCDVCCKLFDKDESLQQHVETQHKEEEKDKNETFSCDVCSRVFLNENNFQRHKRRKHVTKFFL